MVHTAQSAAARWEVETSGTFQNKPNYARNFESNVYLNLKKNVYIDNIFCLSNVVLGDSVLRILKYLLHI